MCCRFIHHPPHVGLLNVLEPSAVAGLGMGRVGFRRRAQYESFMCAHDVLVFESGIHDFGMPFVARANSYAKNLVRPVCAAAARAEECDAALEPALLNQSWYRFPLRAYRQRLASLLEMWGRCREAKPRWRGIFRLAPAPRARARPADCELAQWGFNTQAHHVALSNAVATRMVEAAGFEVFDAFAVTLHAPVAWMDDVRYGVKHKVHESEAVSDLVTQMLLNQLCRAP